MSELNSEVKALHYAVYLMGVKMNIIEPLDDISPPDIEKELPDEFRSEVELFRDKTNNQTSPDDFEAFYRSIRDVVQESYATEG